MQAKDFLQSKHCKSKSKASKALDAESEKASISFGVVGLDLGFQMIVGNLPEKTADKVQGSG